MLQCILRSSLHVCHLCVILTYTMNANCNCFSACYLLVLIWFEWNLAWYGNSLKSWESHKWYDWRWANMTIQKRNFEALFKNRQLSISILSWVVCSFMSQVQKIQINKLFVLLVILGYDNTPSIKRNNSIQLKFKNIFISLWEINSL